MLGARTNEREIKFPLSDCPSNSLDPPGHTLRACRSLWLADFANAHLCSPAARHLENVSIRRGHFKDAVLAAKNFGGIYNFYCAVHRLDHCAPRLQVSKVRRRH